MLYVGRKTNDSALFASKMTIRDHFPQVLELVFVSLCYLTFDAMLSQMNSLTATSVFLVSFFCHSIVQLRWQKFGEPFSDTERMHVPCSQDNLGLFAAVTI